MDERDEEEEWEREERKNREGEKEAFLTKKQVNFYQKTTEAFSALLSSGKN